MDIVVNQSDAPRSTAGGEFGPCLHLKGRFDAFETMAFREAIEELFDSGASTICIDLSQITFIDSSALAELVRIHKQCRVAGGDLVVRSPSDPVTVIFELTRLDSAFRIERPDKVVDLG